MTTEEFVTGAVEHARGLERKAQKEALREMLREARVEITAMRAALQRYVRRRGL